LADGIRSDVAALSRAQERQDPFDDVGGEQLRAELDQFLARHRAQPRPQVARHLRGRILIVARGSRAHAPNPAGKWQPMAEQPLKFAPSSAASRRSTPTSVARAKEAPIRFAPRSETSTSRAPEKSAFSIEAEPSRESTKSTRTI